MVKTAAPEHRMGPGLGGLTVDAGYPTLALGRDASGALVQVSMFRPAPTTVVLIGTWWAARVLVFRALGMGATAAVRADGGGLARASLWTELDHFAAGGGRRVWPVMDERQAPPPGVAWLVLHVFDTGPGGPAVRPALGPWQTQLTVFERPEQASAVTIATANIVLCQRLERHEAEVVAAARGRGAATVELMSTLELGMVAALAGGVDRPLWWAPTSTERRLFGDPTATERHLFGEPGF
ncbi:MAG TPA: hypothetical protein VFC19_53380 [Candidatus Limnocylindrales bacterium]|nr:hypothetical protein [Candidatus Limnocylindrales bacterium]